MCLRQPLGEEFYLLPLILLFIESCFNDGGGFKESSEMMTGGMTDAGSLEF